MQNKIWKCNHCVRESLKGRGGDNTNIPIKAIEKAGVS